MMQTSPVAAAPSTATVREPELRRQAPSWAGKIRHPPIVQVTAAKNLPTTRARSTFSRASTAVAAGEMVAIVGQSGAGKAHFCTFWAPLMPPSAGTVYCASTDVAKLSPREAAAFRNREIGYVWQFHYLLPEFTALENVAMPLLARGTSKREALRVAATGSGRWV